MSDHIPLADIQKLRAIEANLQVELRDGATLVKVVAQGERAVFFVRMPTTLWREFCRRQLATPPPLPKPKGES